MEFEDETHLVRLAGRREWLDKHGKVDTWANLAVSRGLLYVLFIKTGGDVSLVTLEMVREILNQITPEDALRQKELQTAFIRKRLREEISDDEMTRH